MAEKTQQEKSFFSVFSVKVCAGIYGLAFILAVSGLGGCVTAPEQVEKESVFYPSLPNPPRIQFLTRFSEANDVVTTRGRFTEFVLGKNTPESEVIKKPYGVAMSDGRIYVVDTREPGYDVFDLKQQRFHIVSGAEAAGGRMHKPINIAIDRDGTRYITDTGRNQILVFDSDDRYVRAYGTEDQFKPVGVAIEGERLFVTDIQHHQIHVLDKRSGKILYTFGKAGSKEGELYHPTNLVLTADGHLYVADTGNFRIQKFTQDGRFVRSIGSIGSGLGQFARPKGLALDREGHIYVSDAAFENIQVFDADGKLLMFFGEPGDRPEHINLPAAVAVDYDNVALFQKFADPRFKIEYLILVASQFGVNKVSVFGFGKLEGMDYSVTERSLPPAGK